MTDQEKITCLKSAVLELAQEIETVKKHVPCYTGTNISEKVKEIVKDFLYGKDRNKENKG